MLYTLPIYEDEPNLNVSPITRFPDYCVPDLHPLHQRCHSIKNDTRPCRYGRLNIRCLYFKDTKWADFGVVGLRSMEVTVFYGVELRQG